MCMNPAVAHEFNKIDDVSGSMPEHKASFALSFKNFHRNRRTRACRCIAFLFLAALLCAGAHAAGFRVNTTPSVERGLWLLRASENPQKNNYVTVPNDSNPGLVLAVERGYSTPESIYLKKVVETEGDFIDYDANEKSVTVNGEYILMTEIFSQDNIGQPLPRARFPVLLQKGEVWLSSEYIRGFDSRYFGPVSGEKLTKTVPIFTFR